MAKTGSVTLMEHTDGPAKRLVVVSPRLEEWLYRRADACGVKPGDYGLPDSAAELHAIAHYKRAPRFVEFLNKLQADPEMQSLKMWVV